MHTPYSSTIGRAAPDHTEEVGWPRFRFRFHGGSGSGSMVVPGPVPWWFRARFHTEEVGRPRVAAPVLVQPAEVWGHTAHSPQHIS